MGVISECFVCGYRENHECSTRGNFVSESKKLFCFDCVRKALFHTYITLLQESKDV